MSAARIASLVVGFTVAAAAGVARAAPVATSGLRASYDVGFRVGGYGFKREGDDRPGEGWTECRMNGVGVFASRALRGPLFLEVGLDLYTSADFPTPASELDLPIDRMSGLASVAAGARAELAPWLRAYVQLGAGAELTRVAVPYGDAKIRDTQVLPEGFLGVGLDLRIARRTYLGASFRSLVMGNFDYDRAALEQQQAWGFTTPTADEVLAPSLDFAAQGQLYVRREL